MRLAKFTAISAIALSAAVLAAGPANAQEKIRLAASSISLGYMPVYVAEAMGYFKQQGLTVERIKANSGPQALTALMTGDFDVVTGNSSNIPNIRKAGVDVISFAGLLPQYGGDIVATKEWADKMKLTSKSPYKDKLQVLKGATIGVTGAGGGADQMTRYIAKEAGLNADRDMTIIAIPEPAAMQAAFSTSRINIMTQSAPTSLTAVENGGVMMLNLGTGEVPSMDGYVGAVATAYVPWLKKNETAATKFVKGLQLAVDAIQDPARTLQVRDTVHKAVFPDLSDKLFVSLWDESILGVVKKASYIPEIRREKMKQVFDFNNNFAKPEDFLPDKMVDEAYTNEYVTKARAMK